MASTIDATITAALTVVEEFPAADWPAAQDRIVTHDGYNTRHNLHASSTPPASLKYAETLTGPLTLDLTALADPVSGTLDGTGLKVQALKVVNLSATDDLVVDDGAADPYSLNGGAPITLPPLGEALLYFADGLADVDATHKDLDITAGAAEEYQIMLVLG
jgi:hypothetical protein